MRRIVSIAWRTLLVLTFLAAIYWSDLLIYGFRQLSGQLHIVWNARPIEDVLADSTFADSLKSRLRLSEPIRKFATDSLGLNETDNYTTVYDQQGKPALWVLTAAEPLALKPFTWTFPFLGEVEYKGFFRKELGEVEANELRSKGYDVMYRPTGGWSTLGWFKDPLLSNMLRRTEGAFAELLIHELTHATLYLKGSVEYNENFATFVGEQGALHFLQSHFGTDSKQQTTYRHQLGDEQLFGDHMLQACERLDSLYTNMDRSKSTEVLKREKSAFILGLVSGIDKLPLHHPERFGWTPDAYAPDLPGNAWFLSFKRYRSSLGEFTSQLDSLNGNLKAFIQFHKEVSTH
jgi:predicted aminopeptidase